jgi:hypothetical protein
MTTYDAGASLSVDAGLGGFHMDLSNLRRRKWLLPGQERPLTGGCCD